MGRPSTGTVEFRGNPPRWHARVTGRDDQGRTVRPWVDLDRPDLPNTPEGKATAQRLALKRAKKASRQIFVGKVRAASHDVTLGALEEQWFALLDGDSHLKPGSVSAYKSCWTANGRPALGKHPVGSLTVPVLRAWVRELTGELSPSSVRSNAIALTRFLSDARAEGWIALESNPMKHEDVRAMLPTVEAPDADAIVQWTRAEVETLLASPLPHERFGRYLVALVTGLRAGELRGLTFAHLALDAEIPHLRVRAQLVRAREAGDTVEVGTPKTRSSKRDVPLHSAALVWLTWWRDEGWAKSMGRVRSDDSPIFPMVNGEAGRPPDALTLRRDLKRAELSEEFTAQDGTRYPYTFHATRRTFSRLLGDNGVSPDMVGMLCGHAGKSVTERHYMGRSLEAMARAAATLALALPARLGVVPSAPSSRPDESSPESSRTIESSQDETAKVAELAALLSARPPPPTPIVAIVSTPCR
jgi:integrase